MPKYNEKDGFVNSYGFNVLRGMVDQINVVVQRQKEIDGPMTNNEASALEDTILDIMAQDQEHANNEDLRKAINEPVKPSTPHTIDLRKAIQQ